MARKKNPLEQDIEEPFVAHVYAAGCWAVKLNLQGRRGMPDRMIVGPDGFILFVELKRLGREPDELQKFVHKGLRKFGFTVVVPDNLEDAVERFNSLYEKHLLKNGWRNDTKDNQR